MDGQHYGFRSIGAKVYGYSLAPKSEPNFFELTKLKNILTNNTFADILDLNKLTKAINEAKPEIVFHMAAQPLVRESYIDPIRTYYVNVIGTVNLFEAIRKSRTVKAVVNVTTDKCYENKEWVWPYREDEHLGGFDPYSSSKGCSELITSAYRRSFFELNNQKVASARAGNVIGGGDWSKDRLLPDFLDQLIKMKN